MEFIYIQYVRPVEYGQWTERKIFVNNQGLG